MLFVPQWTIFAGITGVVLTLLVLLARASSAMLADGPVETTHDVQGDGDDRGEPLSSLSTGELLINVALSQGVLGSLLLFGAWYAQIPATAFGVELTAKSVGTSALAVGVGLGVGLYVANELAAQVVDAFDVSYSEQLRELLAPSSLGGWVVLLVLVLPVIAGFEEFLFRAALIGAMSTGFAVSPWALAALSTVLFAIGHGTQGPGGMLVTGVLGFVLAAAFIVTGSLLVVVVAHYLVNALEFVVHEGLGVEWV